MGIILVIFLVTSNAKSPEQYLSELPDGRREMITELFEKIESVIPDGYMTTMGYGMLTWSIPLHVTGPTYNGEPMALLSLANQKRHMSLYFYPKYVDPSVEEEILNGFEKINKKPNMGKSCIRFTKNSNIPVDLILEIISRWDVETYIRKSDYAREHGVC